MHNEKMKLTVIPLTLRTAQAFVGNLHRHSQPTNGGRFAIGALADGRLCGVAICARPNARLLDDGLTLDVARVCTDGTPNACSLLYGACRRIGRAMGYVRIISYTLASEDGASLRAVGAKVVATVRAQQWGRPSRRRAVRIDPPPRLRWEL